MSLVRAERRRFHKRRVTKVMLLIGVLILATIGVGMWFSNQKVTGATRAAAAAEAQRNFEESQRAWNNAGKAECERMAKEQNADPAQACAVGPRQEDFRAEYFMPSTYDFKANFLEMATGWAIIMAFVGLVIGASYVGAEWSSGGMMNLLTWQPRRMRVLGTKMLTLAGAMVVWSAVVFVFWVGLQWLLGTYRGTTAGMTSGTWQSFGLTGLRGLGLIAAGSAFGFVLASLGRRTAVAMGVLIALIVVTQFGLTLILYAARVHYPNLYFVGNHMSAWMQGKQRLFDESSCDYTFGSCQPQHIDLTWQMSGAIFGAGLLLLIAAALWQIRRRDVV
jgi:ABC-type transport system involved in multi-copper enzyme maturation permease subunit